MRLKFSELFVDLGFSPRCEALKGTDVELKGYVVDSHDHSTRLLVSEPGGCPHCSQVPAIALPGCHIAPGQAVTLRGTLSFGFHMDDAGNASMLRLENAKVATGLRRGSNS